MNIFELETKNGRVFRVAIENKSQLNRLRKVIADNKNKSYEVFTRIDDNKLNGIHDIKTFERLADSLV
jgi:hypothetical protein